MSVRKGTDSLKSSCAQRPCAQHPQRLASHYYPNKGSSDIFYCEKCSIMLASQGYNVIKISSVNVNNARKLSLPGKIERISKQFPSISNRKNEIFSFMQNLQSIQNQLQHKLQLIQDYLITSQIQHGKLIQQANIFYKQLQQIIQIQKFTTYNSILNKRTIDQAQIRESRNIIDQVMIEIQGMINDIKQNMDAVETVDYNIFNSIMNGYQNKIDVAKNIAKQSLNFKNIQKCAIVLPQIPKSLSTLSDRISIAYLHKSGKTTGNNSFACGFKPQRIVTQEDACVSPQSESQQYQQSSKEYQYEIRDKFDERNDYCGQRQKQQMPKMNKIIQSHGNLKQLAFSFDQNANNSKEFRLITDQSNLDNSKYLLLKGFEQGKLSKIEQRINSKEICQSRESLGQYLNISTSRNHHSLEDTETLLIA